MCDQMNCWHKWFHLNKVKIHLDKEFYQACLWKTLALGLFALYIWVEHRQFSYQQGIFSEKKKQPTDFGNKIIACNCDRYHGDAYKNFSY